MTGRSFLRWIGLGAGGALAVWAVGLLFFVASVAHFKEKPIDASLPPTEAIVVLTGGSERLPTGLELLKAGKGQKLLISGVHPKVGVERILAHSDMPEELRTCCVVLGHAADNTVGNAEETRAFMIEQGFHSLRLVTAHYHMPRSLLLFRRMMPDMEIVPFPVTPDIVQLSNWWLRSGTASLLIGEYNKFLFAALRAALGVL